MAATTTTTTRTTTRTTTTTTAGVNHRGLRGSFVLGASWRPLGIILEPSWGRFRKPLGPLGPLFWGPLGGFGGPSWGNPGGRRALLGPSWGDLGALLGALWGRLGGPPRGLWGLSWTIMEPYCGLESPSEAKLREGNQYGTRHGFEWSWLLGGLLGKLRGHVEPPRSGLGASWRRVGASWRRVGALSRGTNPCVFTYVPMDGPSPGARIRVF